MVLKMSKKGKKTIPLPARPQPPAVSHIIDDITNSATDDILFSYFQNEKSRRFGVMFIKVLYYRPVGYIR